MINKEQKIWRCLECEKLYVSEEAPTACSKCGSKKIVYHSNYMITK